GSRRGAPRHGRGVDLQPSRRAALSRAVLRQRPRYQPRVWRPGAPDSLHHRLGDGPDPDRPRADRRAGAFLPFMKSFLLALLLLAGVVEAFPTKPVRIIVAFPPGGGTDIVARVVGQKLGEGWNQAVVVENRAGASGTSGTGSAARAEADGHTVCMAAVGNMTGKQHLYPQ